MARADLARPEALNDLPWDTQGTFASLNAVFKFVTAEAQGAIDWYGGAKRPKRRLARWLRASAIVLAAVAGVLPMLAQLDGLKTRVEPVWASVSLAAAAAFVVLDRFFGFSTAWVRYTNAEQELRQALQEFALDWEAQRAAWKGVAPSGEEVQKALGRCKAFVTKVHGIVRDETGLWVAEFQDTLKQLDEAVKTKTAAAAQGGVALTVKNGDRCDEAGWTLTVDGQPGERHSGKTAALTGLAAGMHRLVAEGKIDGQPKRAEAAVRVGAGAVAPVEMTLA